MKRIIISFFALLSLSVLATPLAYVQAETSEEAVCGGVEFVSGEACDPAAGESRVKNLMNLGLDVFALVMGIIAVVIIIIAGLTIATSGGDSSKLTRARENIIYASVGLAVIVFARLLVRFVLDKVG